MRSASCLLVALLFAVTFSRAQSTNVRGDWREPGGSVIRVEPCGQDLCARLVLLRPDAPSQFDVHNPDPSKRSQKVCGLQIGYGFHPTDPALAEGGHLYDPRSGKTYQGTMRAEGDHLLLRGYVGIKAFGRTEQWTRVPPLEAVCR